MSVRLDAPPTAFPLHFIPNIQRGSFQAYSKMADRPGNRCWKLFIIIVITPNDALNGLFVIRKSCIMLEKMIKADTFYYL